MMSYKKILYVVFALATLQAVTLSAQSLIRGPYLQMGTPTAVSVRWRTDKATDGVLRYGTSPSALSKTLSSATITREHEFRITGLSPNTKYYYSVGTSGKTIEGGEDCFFVTSPTSAKPTRVWLLGDPGTGTPEQRQVRDTYYKFTGSRHTDLWIMDGDNAMSRGEDSEYTAKLFKVYGEMLKKSVLWTAYGNHDADSSNADTMTGPYFEQHTFPQNGEAGGVASGSEAYYSFDYGNIHFVILDSSESNRLVGGKQVAWLKKDLAANKKEWTIVVMHHPPYTRGEEHSDKQRNMKEVRENFVPVLESYGVDLVIAGHAHCYQRSCMLNGHYGVASTFKKGEMTVQGGSGRVDNGGAYEKDMKDKGFSGTVYMVVGASGKVGGNATNHPAMYSSMSVMGSLVMDFDGGRLDVQYIDIKGARRDSFTIKKINGTTPPKDMPPADVEPGDPVENKAPVAKVTSPVAGAAFTAPASITIAASATDADGKIVKVEFIAAGKTLGSDTTSPYSFVWKDAPAGAQTITVRATDNDGAVTTSSPVLVNVKEAPVATPGHAVTGFTLINADTNQPVAGYESIANGAVILRSSLPTTRLSIRANTTASGVESVRFAWSGNANFRTESEAPYALFGGPKSDYDAGTIANGTHTIAATPFSQPSGKGVAGKALSVTFTISDALPKPPVTGVTGFTLINADTDQPVAGYENLQDGAVISRASLPTTKLTVRVNTAGDIGSVRIGWNQSANYRTVTDGPYVLFGGPESNYYAGTLANKTHTVTATTFSQAGGKGTKGESVKVSFTITDKAPVVVPPVSPPPASTPAPEAPEAMAVTGFTLINADTDQPVAGYENIKNGAVISRASLPTAKLTVRVKTTGEVGSVRMGWNQSVNYRTVTDGPYVLFGGPESNYYAGTISNKTHTVTAIPFSKGSAKGVAGDKVSVTFTIR